MKEKLKNLLLYNGVESAEYEKIQPYVKEKNLTALKRVSFLGSFLLGILFFASFKVDSIAKNQFLYAVFFLIMLCILLIAHIALRPDSKATLPFFYGFLVTAYAFGIILGVPLLPSMGAVTFCVLIFALPLLIIDRPYRVILLQIFAVVIFCVLTGQYKENSIASLDRVNSLSFLFLGISVNYLVMQGKIKQYIYQSYVELERDTDDLTGLMTKAAAMREINAYISHKDNKAALLVIDIDNFKAVNDNLGHAYGDAVLRIMGECIRSVFRVSDIRARFGGDEFIIFLPGYVGVDAVTERVEELVALMKTRLKTSEDALSVTGSIGIAFFPEHGTTYDEVFKKADEALYTSKEKGKNCYTFYFDQNLES